ncbi:MAG: Ig-like domain repeat protein [Pyrinomonadaceae bacterium]
MKRTVAVLAFALVCALYFGPSVSALVTNGSFEAGNFSGWTKSSFINNGFSQPLGAGGADLSAIVGGAGVAPLSLSDPRSNNNLRYPAYGNYTARVNSQNSYSSGGFSRNGNRIVQTLPAYVDPSDGLAHVKFTYAAVMVNPTSSAHTNEQKPYFRVRVINETNANDVLHDFQSFVGEAGKNWQNGASFGSSEFWQYLDWTLIDLKSSPAHPVNPLDSIRIEVLAAGCEPSGHPGYVYIDEITDNEVAGPTVQATGPPTAGSGSAITYTYNYRNGSTQTINPTITATQPTGVVFGSVSDNTNCALNAGTVTCNYSNLAAGGTGSFTVTGTVTASTGTTVAHGAYQIAATGFPTLGGQTVFTNVATSSTATAITSSANPSVSGQNATLTATVSSAGGTPTGTVQFTVGGVNYGAPVTLSGGTAQLSTAGFPVGANNVQAIYSGGPGFTGSTSPVFSQTVNPANSVVTVSTSPNPAVTGQGFTITANVAAVAPGSGTPTGTVTFYVDGVPVCTAVVLASGQATCNAPGMPAGNHVVAATYSGNPNFNGNTGTQSGGTTVNPANTTLGLSASPNPSQSGQAVTVTATVAPVSPGAGTPTGTVTFSVNGSPVCVNAPMSGAQATCNLPTQNAGNHPVIATYNGDANFNTSNGSLVGGLTVNPANTTVGLSASPNPSVNGQAVTVTATVAPVAPGTGTPTGTVTFSVNGSAVCTNAPMTGAQATCNLPSQNPGNHPVTATYNGEANFNTSNGSLTGGLTVNPANTTLGLSASPNPSVTGQGVTVTATVAPIAPGTGTPTGTVTFSVNGNVVCLNVALVAGQATCNLPSQFAGNHAVTATYGGSPNFNGSNGTLTGGWIVNPANTTTAVASSANPSVAGQSVTFTATVSPVAPGSGTPTGTVTFSIDGSPVCTNAAMTGNQATCSSSNFNSGNHPVSATYNGDANYNGSTGSLVGGQGVGAAATSTAVTSSVNPSVTGQSVTFTATVTTVAPGSGTPTGTATFSVDGNPVCVNAALTAGVATCTSSNFTPGTHPVSVTYNGDANSNTSIGTLAGGQVVDAASTSTAVASSVNPSVTGQSVTFTATVSSVAPGSGTPTGTVTFSVDGSPVCTNAAMAAGVATCTSSAFTAGTHPVSATYNGSANHNSSTGTLAGGQVVNAASTSTAVASSVNPSVTGQSVTFTATVSSNAPGSGTPTGTVTFSVDGSAVCTNAAMTAGVATCTSSAFNAGTHPVSATYNADANYNASTGSLAGGQVVNKADTTTGVSASANPAVFGQTVTFTANVTANAPGAGTPTGDVTFVVDGNTLCAAAVMSGGSATCSTSSLSVGSHTVSANYNSDANFNGSNGMLAGGQSVGKSDTTTVVMGSQNPSVYGQPVTFTATVAPVEPGVGTPSGTVSFNFDGIVLCDNVAMTAAQATCTVSSLMGGTHVVTAAYNGDSNFNISAGSLNGGPHVVSKVDSVMAITNQAQLDTPTHVGESYPVNWTVTLVAPGSGTPTGNVTVSDGSASCTAAVAAQTCNLTSTTPGTKTITGTYAGDGNVNGSSATPASHLVNVMITGRVQQFVSGGSNTDMSGVTVSLSGSTTATVTTDSNGRFTFTQLAGGGSFVVAPAAGGFTFDPLSRSYSNVNTNVMNANFVGYDAAAGVRHLRVISQYLIPGDDVIIPLNLEARGNEYSMDFSLGYSANPLKVAEVECGADAPGCSITSDASNFEKLGISVTFATPLTPGDREVVKVRFRSHGNINVGNTLLTFGDEPMVKASFDSDGNPLATTYTDGAVIYARGMESDVSGRYSGDGGLLANDIVAIRHFVVRNLVPHPLYNEFQRADSAPAVTKGDGMLDATDIVQARRFISGLDPSVAPGGPYRPILQVLSPQRGVANDRTVSIGEATAYGSREVAVPITMNGNGDEVAASFTLEFDPSKLTDPRVELADGIDAVLTFDSTKPGRVTVLIDSPSQLTFAKSERQLVNIRFTVAGGSHGGVAAISFGSEPTPSVVSDANGRKLDAGFIDGSVNLSGSGASDTAISGRVQTPDGRGLRNAQVVLTDANGKTRTVTTGSFGNYRFEGPAIGGQLTLTVMSRRYTFEPRTLSTRGDRSNIDLIARN